MALVNPYCTVAQVRSEIRNTDSDLTSVLEEAINQASRFVDRYVGRDFYQHDYSSNALVIDVFDQCCFADELYLPYRPVIEITEVKVLDEVWTEGVEWGRKGGRLICYEGSWPVGKPPDNVIEVKGKFGYAQATSADVPAGIPEEIVRATILVAAAYSGHNVKEIVGLEGNKEQVIDKNVPKGAMEILGLHRLRLMV